MLGFFAFGALAPLEQPKLEVIHRPPSTTRRRGVPALLFVHGAYGGAWCWDEHFLPWFAAHGFDAYALSLRGHGASQGGEQLQQSSIRDYVADLRHVVEGMETPPVLIGHSMGGMVVQKYLEQFPAFAAVLMASVPPGGLGSSIMRLATADPLVFTRMSMVQGGGLDPVDKDNAVRSILPQDLDPEVQTAYSTRMLNESQRALLDMTFMDLPRRWRMHLPPMLVLGAGQDSAFSVAEVEDTARTYGADLQIYPEMAHAMMLDPDWPLAAREIRDWVFGRTHELMAA